MFAIRTSLLLDAKKLMQLVLSLLYEVAGLLAYPYHLLSFSEAYKTLQKIYPFFH